MPAVTPGDAPERVPKMGELWLGTVPLQGDTDLPVIEIVARLKRQDNETRGKAYMGRVVGGSSPEKQGSSGTVWMTHLLAPIARPR